MDEGSDLPAVLHQLQEGLILALEDPAMRMWRRGRLSCSVTSDEQDAVCNHHGWWRGRGCVVLAGS